MTVASIDGRNGSSAADFTKGDTGPLLLNDQPPDEPLNLRTDTCVVPVETRLSTGASAGTFEHGLASRSRRAAGRRPG